MAMSLLKDNTTATIVSGPILPRDPLRRRYPPHRAEVIWVRRNRRRRRVAARAKMELPLHPEVFVSRITRKELKTDKFALEVEHGISFFEHHKNEAVKYGAVAIGVIVLIVGYTIYQRGQHNTRQQALASAIRVQEAPVGQSGNGGLAFPTQEAKDQESIRVFTEIETRHSG